MYVLTEHGRKVSEKFIAECKAKRKEILDAGKDTADETTIPTVKDIENEISFFEDDGEYYNNWGVTDHYDSDLPIVLFKGKDYVEI